MHDLTRFMVKPGTRVKLSALPTDDPCGYRDEHEADEDQEKAVKRIAKLQYKLWAEDRRALLVVLQAMDTAGKDGTIRHVFSGVNPQGVRVTAFKQPSVAELDHDFLWRIHMAVPAKGEIGVFNRSHYEDVLVVRVHNLVPPEVWSKRYDIINTFERLLNEGRTTILKFYLHISKEEQLRRLFKRLDDPEKNWKVQPGDFEERKLWDQYMEAYEDALSKCSTPWGPWHVIPSDHKWVRNALVARIVAETLERMDPRLPPPLHDLAKVREIVKEILAVQP